MNSFPQKPLPLTALSFWRYKKLKHCLASGASYAHYEKVKRLRPNATRNLVFGKLFHKQMDGFHFLLKSKRPNRKAFQENFKSILRVFGEELEKSNEAKHLTKIDNWLEVTDLYRKLSRLFDEHAARIGIHSWQTFNERTLYSQDKLLFGQLDAYFLSDFEVEVVDYKSGMVTDGELPKEDYVDQLYFYAYLINETHGLYPSKLSLTDKNLNTVELDGSMHLSNALAADMRTTLAIYNAQINSFGLVDKTPSSLGCVYCDQRPGCDSYWGAAEQLDFPQWAQSASGKQVGAFIRNKQGAISVELLVDQGTLARKRIKIGGIFEGRFDYLQDKPGQFLSFIDIRVRPGSVEHADVTDRTIIKVTDTV